MDFLNEFLRHPLSHPLLLTPLVFALGAAVGSLLNVCILRLPLEKSIFWPSSHCGNCLKGIWMRDNIPILSYLRLKGKCRHCGATFSSRYMWIEILTGLIFAGTFLYYVTLDSHGGLGMPLNPFEPTREVAQRVWGVGPWGRLSLLGLWAGHLVLLCCLLVTTFTDIDYQEIPLRITIFGTVIGLLLSLLMPWPWPCNPNIVQMILEDFGKEPFPAAMQFWPWWSPAGMQDFPAPYSNFGMGLLSGVIGAVVGTGLVRAIRLVFGWGFGKEAMGLGDADLMMMIGAFLGWQATILVLIYAVFLGIGYAVYVVLFNRNRMLPFGPFIAGGVVLLLYAPTVIAWAGGAAWLHDNKRVMQFLFFFNPTAVVLISTLAAVLAFTMAFMLRLFHLVRLAPAHDTPMEPRPRPRPAPMPVTATAPAASPTPVATSPTEADADELEKPTVATTGKKGKKKRKK